MNNETSIDDYIEILSSDKFGLLPSSSYESDMESNDKDDLASNENIDCYNYKFKKLLGKGGFGSVNLVEKNSKLYIHKIIKYNEPKKLLSAVNEVDILKFLSKNNCKKYIACYEEHFINFENQTFNIITKLYPNFNNEEAPTLFDFINQNFNNPNIYNLKNVFLIIKNILRAIIHLHVNNIIHNDLKPENILINTQTFEICIIDFGFSCKKCHQCIFGYTENYAHPYIIQNKNLKYLTYNEIYDIYSLSIIFKQLIKYIKSIRYKTENDIINYLYKIKMIYNYDIIKFLKNENNISYGDKLWCFIYTIKYLSELNDEKSLSLIEIGMIFDNFF